MGATVLRTVELTKVFGNNVANDRISLELNTGEVLAIIGENGAGKSTFCKMLTGVNKPDGGEIHIDGKKMEFKSVQESIDAGISMVYQERNLVPMLTGAQNIGLGETSRGPFFLNDKLVMQEACKTRDFLGLKTPLDVPIEKLGAGEQQLIEIMRALGTHPKILILDEPTASLGKGEIEPFLQFVNDLKKNSNIGVIFISHKIEEVYAIADRIAVFTDGRNVVTKDVREITQEQCIQAMLRTNKSLEPIHVPEKDMSQREVILHTETGYYDKREHTVPFTGRRGEVVGFYGQVGSGRTEFAEYLVGLRKAQKCDYTFCGERITNPNPSAMIEKGMILTPEKRADAVFRSQPLIDNICNLFLKEKLVDKAGFVSKKKSLAFTEEVLKDNKVKFASIHQPITDLSGGNMQKLIIGRSV